MDLLSIPTGPIQIAINVEEGKSLDAMAHSAAEAKKMKKEEKDMEEKKINYKFPPDLDLCYKHMRANLLRDTKEYERQKAHASGDIDSEITKEEETNVQKCTCCGNAYSYPKYPILTKLIKFSVFGEGFPLLFKLAKVIGYIVCAFLAFGIFLLIFYLTAGFGAGIDEDKETAMETYPPYMRYLLYPTICRTPNHQIYVSGIIVFIATIVVFVVWLRFSQILRRKAIKMDENFLSIADYSVMLKNIPVNDNFNQNDFLQEIFGGDMKQNIVRSSFVYDIKEVMEETEKLEELEERKALIESTREAYKLHHIHWFEHKEKLDHVYPSKWRTCQCCRKETHRTLEELTEKIEKLEEEIEEKYKDRESLQQTEFAFIIFKKPQMAIDIIKQSSREGYYYNNTRIKCIKPPEPEDISWEGLPVSKGQRRKRVAITYTITCAFIIVAGVINFFIHQAMEHAIEEAQHENKSGDSWWLDLLSEFPSAIIIIIINIVLAHIIEYMTEKEMIWTKTGEQISIGLKTTMAMLINSAGVPLILSIVSVYNELHKEEEEDEHMSEEESKVEDPWEYIYSPKGFVHKIFFVWITISIIEPLFEWIPIYFIQLFKRIRVRMQGPTSTLTQIQANKMFDPPIFEIPCKYGYNVFIFLYLCSCFPLYPMGAVITLIGIFINYFMDKYMVLRHCRKPEIVSDRIAIFFIKFAGVGILALITSNALFSWLLGSHLEYLPFILGISFLLLCLAIYLPIHILHKKRGNLGSKGKLGAMVISIFQENDISEQFINKFEEEYDILEYGNEDYMYCNPVTRHDAIQMVLELEYEKAQTDAKSKMKGIFGAMHHITTISALKVNIGEKRKTVRKTYKKSLKREENSNALQILKAIESGRNSKRGKKSVYLKNLFGAHVLASNPIKEEVDEEVEESKGEVGGKGIMEKIFAMANQYKEDDNEELSEKMEPEKEPEKENLLHGEENKGNKDVKIQYRIGDDIFNQF